MSMSLFRLIERQTTDDYKTTDDYRGLSLQSLKSLKSLKMSEAIEESGDLDVERR